MTDASNNNNKKSSMHATTSLGCSYHHRRLALTLLLSNTSPIATHIHFTWNDDVSNKLVRSLTEHCLNLLLIS